MKIELEIDDTRYALIKLFPPRMEYASTTPNPHWTIWISTVPVNFSVSWYGIGPTPQEAYADAVEKLEARREYLESGRKFPPELSPNHFKKPAGPLTMPDLGDI